MKKKIMEKWVKALRSGKYKQAKHELKSYNGGYCCLGVLCNISKKDKLGNWDRHGKFLGEDTDLPKEVMIWAGIKDDNGKLKINNKINYLTRINDSEDKNFKEIADIIEKNWRKL